MDTAFTSGAKQDSNVRRRHVASAGASAVDKSSSPGLVEIDEKEHGIMVGISLLSFLFTLKLITGASPNLLGKCSKSGSRYLHRLS